jgi:hydroxymethylpyrimidine pyrophosphatase-like HAD family hydrolase
MTGTRKLATPPRDDLERHAMSGLHGLEIVPRAELRAEYVLRVTYFSRPDSGRHASSEELAREAERAIAQPMYMTHFPLNALPMHRASPLFVLDVHPPCQGKAEGLRALEELYGVPRARAVAIGDAGNDVPMLAAAGLGVAMGHATPDALAVARRVIGDNQGRAVAELVEELFLRP